MNARINTTLTIVKHSPEQDEGLSSSQICGDKTQMPQYDWPSPGSGKKHIMDEVRSSVTSTPPMGQGDEKTELVQLASENVRLKKAHAEQEFELASKIYELEQQLQAAQQNHTPRSSENDESFLEELVEKNQQLQEQLQAAQQQHQAPNQKEALILQQELEQMKQAGAELEKEEPLSQDEKVRYEWYTHRIPTLEGVLKQLSQENAKFRQQFEEHKESSESEEDRDVLESHADEKQEIIALAALLNTELVSGSDLNVLKKMLQKDLQRSTDLVERSESKRARQKEEIESLVVVLSETKREDQIVMSDLKKGLEEALSENESMKGGLSGAKDSVELLEIEIEEHRKRSTIFLQEFSLRVFCEQRLSLQEQLKQKEERLSTLGRQHLESSAHVTVLEHDLAAVQESSDKRFKDLDDALHNHRLEQEGSRERIDSLHDLASKTLLTHQSDQASAHDVTDHNAFLEEDKAGLCNEHDALQNHFVQHQQNISSLHSQIHEGDTRVDFLENELTLVKLVLSMQKADLEVLKKLLQKELQRSTDLVKNLEIKQARQAEGIESLVGLLSETKRKDQIVVADLEKELEGALSKNESMKSGLSVAKNSIESLEIEIEEHTKRNSSFLEEFSLRVVFEQRLSLQKQREEKEERLSTLGRQHQESSTRVTALESDLAMFQESSDKRFRDLEEELHNHRLEQETSRECIDSLHDIASKMLLSGPGCA
jgi:hypothetical protein